MKSKSLMIIIFTIVVIAGIALLLIKPVVFSVLASWRDLSKAKENLQLISEKKQILESLQSNQDLTKVASIAEKYIPKEEESGQLILELTAMAAANNLQVEQTSIEKSKEAVATAATEATGKTSPTPATTVSPEASKAKTVDFTMKINGTFTDFINFLKAIETSSRLILIKDISMQSGTGSSQTVSFNVGLSGSAYYKKDVSLEQNLENIKLSQETLDAFLDLKTYGLPINLPSESGFGRTNPFEGY